MSVCGTRRLIYLLSEQMPVPLDLVTNSCLYVVGIYIRR